MPEHQPGQSAPTGGAVPGQPAPGQPVSPAHSPAGSHAWPGEPPEYLPPVDPWADVDTPWLLSDVALAPMAPHPPVAPHPIAPHSPAAPYPTTRHSSAAPQPIAPQSPAAPHPTGPHSPAPPNPTGPSSPAGPHHPGAPTPTRRRRRWPRVIVLFGVATLVLCCGVPGYLGWPMWQQYPATATLPTTVADLRLREDNASKALAGRLSEEMQNAHQFADHAVAGVYADRRDKRVTLVVATGFWLQPDSELAAEFERLAGHYGLAQVGPEDSGQRGRHLWCGKGRSGNSGVVVCGSADHGSLTTGVFTRLNVADSAELLRRLQPEIVTTD